MSKQIKDGGPAFPRAASEYEPNELRSDGLIAALPYNGMSLRDWYAGQALIGMLSNDEFIKAMVLEELTNKTKHHKSAAIGAYRFADAMIAEREKGEK